jgi:outer membrane receptor protein involved in Fe transport
VFTPGGSAHIVTPKGSVAAELLRSRWLEVETFANYGHGFHSNDVRSAEQPHDVSPLARAVGAEVGFKSSWWDALDLSVSLFRLDLQSEIVWSGDLGTTEPSAATRRDGVEVESRYAISKWLSAELDLTFTHARFRDGTFVPLAPQRTWAGGLVARHALGSGVGRGALRFFGISDRAATNDGALVAKGFTQFDLALGYTWSWFDLGLDVENLLNGVFRSAQFATISRLRSEPELGRALPPGFSCGASGRPTPDPDASGRFFGCEDLHFTPANPLTLRALATLYLD